jgi:hypothetical protein
LAGIVPAYVIHRVLPIAFAAGRVVSHDRLPQFTGHLELPDPEVIDTDLMDRLFIPPAVSEGIAHLETAPFDGHDRYFG